MVGTLSYTVVTIKNMTIVIFTVVMCLCLEYTISFDYSILCIVLSQFRTTGQVEMNRPSGNMLH